MPEVPRVGPDVTRAEERTPLRHGLTDTGNGDRLGVAGSFFCGQLCFARNCEWPHRRYVTGRTGKLVYVF